jgi:arginyl-tRNA synthetase
MDPKSALQSAISEALNHLYQLKIDAGEVLLEDTRVDFEGDFTLVCFPYLKISKKNPEATAKEIGSYLSTHYAHIIAKFNVVKGFLNIVLADNIWIEKLQNIAADPNFGCLPENGIKVMVEFSSPNTNKPLHLGHLRNNFLGNSLSSILKAAGYTVIKANLINDRGIHICKSMLAYQESGLNETPESSGLKGDHLVGKYYVLFDQQYKKDVAMLIDSGMSEEQAKKEAPILKRAQQMLVDWENGNQEVIALWKKMNSWVYEGFEQTYRRMGVDFDKYYYESDTYLLGKDIVNEGLEKGVFYRKEDNSVWVDLTAEGLDHKLVLRGDGTSVYITQDMGTADLKSNDFGIQRSIYVVGNEQDYHFQVLFKILKKLGRPYADGLYHLSYGMVELPSGKMKSREGTVVDADDLMEAMVETAKERTSELGKIDELDEEASQQLYEMLGIGAIKYFLLKVDAKKKILFNPEESIELQGNTATAIQYTHARASSILRKAMQLNIEPVPTQVYLNSAEKQLIKLLTKLPEKIQEAADNYSPAIVANYMYEVSREYNTFFAQVPVFKAESSEHVALRVYLSALTAQVLRFTGGLLGIQMPERM